MAQAFPQLREITAAARLENIRYAIRDLAVLGEKLASEGHRIISLNIGDPVAFDFDAPPHLIEAALRAMRDGKNGYAPSPGIPVALDAIRAEAERNGIRNIQTVFITEGVSEAVDICLSALVNPGENILTPSPEYPLYSAVLGKVGARINPYRLDEALEWAPDLDDLEAKIDSKTRAIVVINPNNPTGALYPRLVLERIIEIARRNGLVIFADEIYDKLVLDGEPHAPLAALASDVPVVTFNGLSKSFLAPGWRIGWGIASGNAAALKPYIEGVHKLLRARLCANHPLQYAIPAALNGSQEHLAQAIQKVRSRRDRFVDWCRRTPRISCVTPRGAFYAFPRIDIRDTDEHFVKQLLQEKHVLVVHGSGFGQDEGTRHFRVVLLPPEAVLEQALERISALIRERWS